MAWQQYASVGKNTKDFANLDFLKYYISLKEKVLVGGGNCTYVWYETIHLKCG